MLVEVHHPATRRRASDPVVQSPTPLDTSNCKINGHFSIQNHHFSGAILHSFCIFNCNSQYYRASTQHAGWRHIHPYADGRLMVNNRTRVGAVIDYPLPAIWSNLLSEQAAPEQNRLFAVGVADGSSTE